MCLYILEWKVEKIDFYHQIWLSAATFCKWPFRAVLTKLNPPQTRDLTKKLNIGGEAVDI